MELREFKCRMCGACYRIKDGIVRVSDAEIARIAAFLAVLFTMLFFVATGQCRIAFFGGKITVEQKQSPDNSTTERRSP